MRLIQTPGAPNPRRVQIFLAEKGIEVAVEERDLMAGELKTDEFRRLNPFETVPVLVLDDGTAVSESIAICRYFEELQPEPNLFGRAAVERAVIEMWQRRIEFRLLLPVANVFRHLHPKMADLEVPQVAAWGEANRDKVARILRFLDRELASRAYIAGDRFTVADITAWVAYNFMKPAKLARPDGLPNLQRWHEHVAARPSALA